MIYFFLPSLEHDDFPPLHLLYYEEAHFGHGGHYQSIHPLNTPPSEQVEQPVESFSDDIGLSNLDVELPPLGNSTSMIPPPMENQVIIMLELTSLKIFISYNL